MTRLPRSRIGFSLRFDIYPFLLRESGGKKKLFLVISIIEIREVNNKKSIIDLIIFEIRLEFFFRKIDGWDRKLNVKYIYIYKIVFVTRDIWKDGIVRFRNGRRCWWG